MIEILREAGHERVYAFDPGDSTGVCYLRRSCYTDSYTRTFTQEEFFRFLVPYDRPTEDCVAIYEDFVSRSTFISRRQIAPQIIGALLFWARLRNLKILKVTPSETHRVNRNDLKRAGWVWHSEHELDAIRILVTALLKIKHAKA